MDGVRRESTQSPDQVSKEAIEVKKAMEKMNILILLFVLACLSTKSMSFTLPFFSHSPPPPPPPPSDYQHHGNSRPASVKFSIQGLDDAKGMKLLDEAKSKLAVPNGCWQKAYRSLFSSCAEVFVDKEKQSRLAWLLSNCFQMDSGRSAFPPCEERSQMVKCLGKLDDLQHKVYLEFFLETNSICHQLQADAFKHDTERLVNELSKSARFAEEKLEIIEEKSEQLLLDSNKVQEALTSVDLQTKQVAQASRAAERQMVDILMHSEATFEQSKSIAATQTEMKEGLIDMKDKLESSMARLHESYSNLDDGIMKLRDEAIEIEKEIKVVGNSMSSAMQDLQTKADDIGDVAGISLEKQKQLLDGQYMALESIDSLKKFQSQAIKESQNSMERLAELSHHLQEELLHKHEEVHQAHNRLMESSQAMLAAQEEFQLKQSSMFMAIDKLFALHNAILVESRAIKAFFFYSCAIFLIYMLTSAKQTHRIRARLYLGLCITFLLEFIIIKSGAADFDQEWNETYKLLLTRSFFLIGASIQILHSIFTYRDYEVLNHELLRTLVEKVQKMERIAGNADSASYSSESDSSISKYSWIFEELPDDVDKEIDPDYMLIEQVGENSIPALPLPASKIYNLRSRRQRNYM